MRRLISFDIDGTMEFGDPPGPITVQMAKEAQALRWVIGSCSDRTVGNQRQLWELHGVSVDFTVTKSQLETVRRRFELENYLHIGDTNIDRQYALWAGFEFLHVDDLPLAVWPPALDALRSS